MKTLKIVALLFVSAALCLAADAVVAPAPATKEPIRWLPLIITPIVTAVFAALRMYSDKIPAPVIVIGAPLLGSFLDGLGAYAGVWDSDGKLGLVLGACAVYLHQLAKQTKVIGSKPPDTENKP